MQIAAALGDNSFVGALFAAIVSPRNGYFVPGLGTFDIKT